VREDALPALAAGLDLPASEVTGAVAVRRRDALERVARVEITASVNGFFAELAAYGRRPVTCELADARSLPLQVPAAERWWLRGTDAYGCLRAGELWSPFLVAWDRAAAPDRQRRRRACGWLAGRVAVGRSGVGSRRLAASAGERPCQSVPNCPGY